MFRQHRISVPETFFFWLFFNVSGKQYFPPILFLCEMISKTFICSTVNVSSASAIAVHLRRSKKSIRITFSRNPSRTKILR